MDIIIFNDLTQIILDKINIHVDFDTFPQYDESCKSCLSCSNIYYCPGFCTGVIVFRNNDVISFISDQDFLGVKNIFLNRSYTGLEDDEDVKYPESCPLLHFNYMVWIKKEISSLYKGAQ